MQALTQNQSSYAYNIKPCYQIIVDPYSCLNYNSYRLMEYANEDIKELFAISRAIYLTFLHNAITCQQAKARTKPLLDRINARVEAIAKEHKVKPKYITFYDLGVNL